MSSGPEVLVLALALPLALAGCGFRPLYGGGPAGAAVSAQLDEVDVGLLPDRQGQLLRQALEADLQRAGAPGFYRYYLKVSYGGWAGQPLGLQPDSSNTRVRYIASARWELTAEGNRTTVIARGTAEAMDAANIIDNQNFAATLDQGVLRHHFAQRLARQITAQLAAYFRNHPDRG
ncbi:hypothetical protein [Acidiphilium sp. C61]|uniref:hypothetical protein n=1 Tax=Acidiphilium sp. C61 TaxID=1671485 RepID=UPI00157B3DC9|nr:hypothetical protein [Acidiphilium sp. C61]